MIFISYSKKDILVARKIVNFLSHAGYQFWIDYAELDLSKNVEKQLELAIKNAKFFILISTENADKSFWVDLEYKLAKKHLTNENIIKVHNANIALIRNKLTATVSNYS